MIEEALRVFLNAAVAIVVSLAIVSITGKIINACHKPRHGAHGEQR